MWTAHIRYALLALLVAVIATPAAAQTREQARRIHDRLAGVPPTATVLQSMTDATTASHEVCADNGATGPECAAYIAMENPGFYNVTLKTFAAPWTNRDFNAFVPLNDYTATVIGMIRDDADFRNLLSEDIQYVGRDGTVTAAPSGSNNAHYEQLEAGNHNLKDVLEPRLQSGINGLPTTATAGVITSRAAAEAFFVAGTNRAMFRFTMVNHFCEDMEQLHDPRLSPDRIRQDVSRSPGGDSRLFLNNCVGCHTGMDPMAQAFAYYNYNVDTGSIEYTDGIVQPKYFNNDLNFPPGFRTPDDNWTNYWRTGQNRYLGFYGPGIGDDFGAKSLGVELSHSDGFAQCQVRKVFKAVCLREPETVDDHQAFDQAVTNFAASGYRMKKVFADTAEYCMGD
ncbi:MAG: hypothetical protein KJP08_03730 [Gammaproteobacteria bacterium]|nr:hypothetical protein [Gammaproteobacteria bacterium]NNF48283.1 hypothetical protein [Woeseiaceae bacterium]MBT8093897.1 hypothetical protein [Gammaproteobacteria bacterium]MBT8104467.1 hypothetical protein [Gammaproteobacteria bacterium]NNK24482.1 hypothetical protein [Woeseiaceae bacterium]